MGVVDYHNHRPCWWITLLRSALLCLEWATTFCHKTCLYRQQSLGQASLVATFLLFREGESHFQATFHLSFFKTSTRIYALSHTNTNRTINRTLGSRIKSLWKQDDRTYSRHLALRGLPYMTSALEGGGGPQKADKKNEVAWILYMTRGWGGQIIRNFCRRHIWKPPSFNLKAPVLSPSPSRTIC